MQEEELVSYNLYLGLVSQVKFYLQFLNVKNKNKFMA